MGLLFPFGFPIPCTFLVGSCPACPILPPAEAEWYCGALHFSQLCFTCSLDQLTWPLTPPSPSWKPNLLDSFLDLPTCDCNNTTACLNTTMAMINSWKRRDYTNLIYFRLCSHSGVQYVVCFVLLWHRHADIGPVIAQFPERYRPAAISMIWNRGTASTQRCCDVASFSENTNDDCWSMICRLIECFVAMIWAKNVQC